MNIIREREFIYQNASNNQFRLEIKTVVLLAKRLNGRKKKSFNWKGIGTASFAVNTDVGIGVAALTVNFNVKLPKKS